MAKQNVRLFHLIKEIEMPKKSTVKTADKLQIEAYLQQLEGIVDKMESSATTLDESLELYKDGVELAVTLAERLKTAEGEVSVLMEQSGKVFKDTFERELP